MWSFFADLVRNVGIEHTILVMDAEETGKTRRYHIHPSRMLAAWGGSLLAAGLVVGLLLAFTPVRTLIPGYGTAELEKSAQLNTMRLRSLQDSLAAQRRYIKRLRQLITGRVDSIPQPKRLPEDRPSPSPEQSPEDQGSEEEGLDADRSVHEQPAVSPSVVSVAGRAVGGTQAAASRLSFPLPSPVASGFPTREFDPRTDHYGIDVAVSEEHTAVETPSV